MDHISFMITATRPYTSSVVEYMYKVPRTLPDGVVMDDDAIEHMLESSRQFVQDSFWGWEIEVIT